MAIPLHDWTQPLRVASQRADPSGVQDAGTVVQAWLLPGMATVTPNVRYISLFTAVRYLRQQAGDDAAREIPLRELWRRVEALIAASSVLHHENPDGIPLGIIGRGYAGEVAKRETIPLATGLQNPPYNIYRGSLGALGLFDLGTTSDPLYRAAEALARAWDPDQADEIGDLLKKGILPPELPRSVMQPLAGAFCLCRVPDASREQQETIDLLFGLGSRAEPPSFREDEQNGLGMRMASWRLLLDLVACSEGRPLQGEHLMARILEPDVVEGPLIRPLRNSLLVWRWVAARSFFERGWTVIFNQTLALLRGAGAGLTSAHLREAAEGTYRRHSNDGVDELLRETRENFRSPSWLVELFDRKERRDCLQMIMAGLLAAKQDAEHYGRTILKTLFEGHAIPFGPEERRLNRALANGAPASEFFAEISEDTLIQHVRTALRKMSQGNPDSLHVDYDDGRWIVPTKALNWGPLPASASSRLDIGLGWATQLGLVSRTGQTYALTPLGWDVRRRWDQENVSWA